MATESNVFTVNLDDEQLAAAIEARTISAGSASSFTQDGCVIHYAVAKENDDAPNVVTVTVLEKPFYVSMDEIEKYVNERLIPPAPPAGESGAAKSPASSSAASAHTAAAPGERLERRPQAVEHRRESK
jgi:hypothetical protein